MAANPFTNPGTAAPAVPSRGNPPPPAAARTNPPPPAAATTASPDPDPERTLMIKQEAFVYKIPPQTKAVGFKASDWSLDRPDWTGKMRLVSWGKAARIRLEERTTDKVHYIHYFTCALLCLKPNGLKPIK